MMMSLVVGFGLTSSIQAQFPVPSPPAPFVDPLRSAPATRPAPAPDVQPTYRYALTRESGEYLILVQSFRNERETIPAKKLAEEFAEILRTEYKLPAYILDWGWKERQAQKEYIAEQKRKWEEFVKARQGEVIGEPRIKAVNIPDHYAVVVGSFKDMDAASDYLKTVRKLKAPPEKYTHKSISDKGYSPLNPFLTAFVGPNPLIARKAVVREDNGKLDDFSRKLNDGEEFSLLKARKPWTLVVRNFQGLTSVSNGDDAVMGKTVASRNSGYLNASAGQAHELAKMLRTMGYDSYVLHMPKYSLLTVGNFNSADDPQLVELAKKLASLKLYNSPNQVRSNDVYMELNRQPQAMEIPR